MHFTEPDIWDLVYPGSHIVICSYVQRWAPETFKPTPGFSDLFPNYLLVPGNGGVVVRAELGLYDGFPEK